jgi:integrase
MDDKGNLTDPKTKAGIRRVPITPRLRKHLVALRGVTSGVGYVFGNAPSIPFGTSTRYRHARAAWEAAGIAPIALHECRHSCISTWVASGVNIKAVSTYAGHSSITITLDRYGHLMPDAHTEALERIAAYERRAEDSLEDSHAG